MNNYQDTHQSQFLFDEQDNWQVKNYDKNYHVAQKEDPYFKNANSNLIDLKLNVLPKLNFTDIVLVQITKAHMLVNKGIEWCGILVYRIKSGSINDLSSLEIETVGIVPLDIGTAAFTSANIASMLGEVSERYPEVIDDMQNYKIGLIHTHHNMETFFSGTDSDDLYTNAEHHLFYLSLVVNYNGRYTAKLAFKSRNLTILNEREEHVQISEVNKYVFYTDLKCTITPDANTTILEDLKLKQQQQIKQYPLTYKDVYKKETKNKSSVTSSISFGILYTLIVELYGGNPKNSKYFKLFNPNITKELLAIHNIYKEELQDVEILDDDLNINNQTYKKIISFFKKRGKINLIKIENDMDLLAEVCTDDSVINFLEVTSMALNEIIESKLNNDKSKLVKI